jgi:prevent-host-death family protein
MAEIASRELRNRTRQVLDRVHHGEHVTITVDGRPVATIEPLHHRPRWLDRRAFLADVLSHQADAGLTDDLAHLADETTDDLPFR